MKNTKGMINQCINFHNIQEKELFKRNYLLEHNLFNKAKEGKILLIIITKQTLD